MNRAVFTTREAMNHGRHHQGCTLGLLVNPQHLNFLNRKSWVTQLVAFLVAMGIKGLRP